MHAISLLEAWLRCNCEFTHRARAGVVVKMVDSLLSGGKATLTELGRHVRGRAFEKHRIKCADRLLGNEHLHAECFEFYQAMARWLLSATLRPLIIIDGSDVEPGRDFVMLKAAVSVGGRALTSFEEVHPLKRYNNPKVHHRFLERLQLVIPACCCPIIITDAGFRGPWFRSVESLGWDWIGRVRNVVKYCVDGSHTWRNTTSLYYKATLKPSSRGWSWLSHKHPYGCYLHLYKAFVRGPGRPRRRRGAMKPAKRAQAREPWLLATSLSPHTWSARRVVRAYEKRMHIEETFRDLKNQRWGYGLQHSRSRSTRRLDCPLNTQRHHGFRGTLNGTKDTDQIDIERLAKILRQRIEKSLRQRDARIVDKHRNQTDFGLDAIEHCVDLQRLTHIASYRQCVAAQFFCRYLYATRVDIRQNQLRPISCQGLCTGKANALSDTG
ncbi:MAG: hypothetical protein ACI9DC_004290 [Gammaproteobacteria bacterium]|jgi:hypothetical protein